ncbi:MAG: molybdopterin-dependent oxidoreductase [Acidiferrobacterales bacterium]|nr:molybdopterin-dependent oxidoreductase [Acidiferrobacterales bacterium]
MQRRQLTATHWGAYQPIVKNGRLVEMPGVDFDPDPSPISDGWIDAYDHPARIRQPCVRRGFYENGLNSNTAQRGCEPFVGVDWDTAERIVADSLRAVRREYGNEAIYAGSYGWASAGKFHHAPSQLFRFLNCFGGYTYSKNTYSFAAAEVIMPHVMGNFFILLVNTTAWPSVLDNSDLFVAFGGIPMKNTQVEFGGHACHVQCNYMEQAARRGIRFVSVSPIKDDIDQQLNSQWLAIVPNTDVALMLGLAQTLLKHNLHNRDFLDRYCVGFERFREYLTGESDGIPKTAQWAESICGIAADQIEALAMQMAQNRTMVSITWALTRQEHGEQAYWSAVALAAMLGQIGQPGGGIGFGYGSVNGVGNMTGRLRFQNLPTGSNPVANFIPVARISDMLLNPGTEFDYDGQRYTYPDIEMIYWAGGNPFHHHQDLNRLIKAWRKPKCTVIHDSFWTATARYSDVVLPVATTLERTDISSSPRDAYAVHMDQILPLFAESRTDHRIFAGIARQLGFEEEFTQNRDEHEWLRLLYQQTKETPNSGGAHLPEFDEFVKNGWFRVDDPARPGILLQPFIQDPENKPLRTPSGKIEIFSEVIDSFNYADCPGHPAWIPPSEWLGKDGIESDELHLISNQPSPRLHSQLDHGMLSQAHKLNGREPIRINRDDARARNIEFGDVVRVYNQRGEFLATAKPDENLRQGVLQIATGAWFDPEDPDVERSICKHGNPNMVTHDRGTSRLGQGPAAMTCLVKIEKLNRPAPEVSAFAPPTITSIHVVQDNQLK